MKCLFSAITLLFLAGLTACGSSSQQSGFIISGGTIITVDPNVVSPEAMYVSEGVILGLGSKTELKDLFPDTGSYDLEGRTIVPGFIDSHAHVHELGQDRRKADLTGTDSVEEMVARLQAFYPAPEPGKWLRAQGWDEGVWASKGYPDRDALDVAYPDNPVQLESLHGFAGLYNGKALATAGIDRDTPDPEGGKIIRRPNGEPSGVMEVLAQNLIRDRIPAPTGSDIQENIIAGLNTMAAAGVTSVHEAGMPPDRIDAYRALAEEGKLPVRVYGMLNGNDDALMAEWFERGPLIDDDTWFTVRSIKVYYDGSLGSRTALMAAPYSDEPEKANMTERISLERVKSLGDRAAARGFQMSTHAIGDEGNNRTLNIYEASLKGHEGLDHRWRVEHAQVVLPDYYDRTAGLGIISSMQSSHAVGDSKWAEDRVGPDRIRHAYAWQRILQAGGRLVMNSDLPGEPWMPIETLYFAVNRRPLDDDAGQGWYSDQALSVQEALHAMTLAGAHAAFQEARIGSLSEGKLADFVELDKDPRVVAPNDLKTIQIVRTWVGGNVIAENGQAD